MKLISIEDYFLALPVQYFSYEICGLPDSTAVRKEAILKKDVQNGYLKFEEECTGSFNEIKLFTGDQPIIALTKYHGEMTQTFYLLAYSEGNWVEKTSNIFPAHEAIAKEVRRNAALLRGDDRERLEISIPSGHNIPYEFYLPVEGNEIKVLLDREFTDEDIQLAAIQWKENKFELKQNN